MELALNVHLWIKYSSSNTDTTKTQRPILNIYIHDYTVGWLDADFLAVQRDILNALHILKIAFSVIQFSGSRYAIPGLVQYGDSLTLSTSSE